MNTSGNQGSLVDPRLVPTDTVPAVLLEVMADRIERGDHLKSTEEGS
jgi:hypothetical protein